MASGEANQDPPPGLGDRPVRFTPTGPPTPPSPSATQAPGPPGPDPQDTERGFHRARWRKHRALALFLGALGGGLAGWANTTYGLALGLPFAAIDPNLVIVVVVAIVAPLVEEHVKLLTLVLLRAEEKAAYTPRRWMVLGAFAGAGFGLAEAMLYFQSLAGLSLDVAGLNLATRLVLTVPLHALTVTATGYGYGLSRHTRSPWPLVRGLTVAVLAHAAFNGYQVVQSLGGAP